MKYECKKAMGSASVSVSRVPPAGVISKMTDLRETIFEV
jgi:hypothetical protein